MSRESRVIKFYVLCNKLKNVIRTGWNNWKVKSPRVESVAEHIYGVQMLALAMYSEYQYEIDIKKVIYMLAVHELEEIIIGDLTFYQVTKEEKKKIGMEAICKILEELLIEEEIKSLITEFENRETQEAIFAYHCDKLECDLQCKLYDEGDYMNPFDHGECTPSGNKEVMTKLKNGEITWSSSWINHDKTLFKDDNFIEVLNYARDNLISINEKSE